MIAPTLIVGLGGSGSKIVQKVYKLATPAQRKNLSFVVFDTDINELRDVMEATPMVKTVQISANLTVGEYLDADRKARDEWFPVNRIMNRKAMTEGAGQVRAISRLAIDSVIQQGLMKPLDEAIQDLFVMSGNPGDQALRVMLVGSLCGGTGSGLLLPVALYIRHYIKTRLQLGSAIIRGFFLLPEVFHHVVTKLPERNNQACNAYAAIREIDAFMMKGDGTLPENYDLHYYIPRPGSDSQDDIADSPMDFCFLYDAQNIDGKKLLTYADCINHAANCIYAQSIAPTSKRSNSSEDNVIGDVVREGGRNRYCGAGSSMMIYPVEDIIKYLTLVWARDNISDEWLEIDRAYKVQHKQYMKQRRAGIAAPVINKMDHYINTVAQASKDKEKAKSFQISVRNMCYKYSPNGMNEEGAYWEHYDIALEKYIRAQIDDLCQEMDIADARSICETTASVIKGSAESTGEPGGDDQSASANSLAVNFDSWYGALKRYQKVACSYTEALGERLAYSLFRDETNYAKTDRDYRIEYWLRQGGADSMIHPNAVRFFLGNTLKQFKLKRDTIRGSLSYTANGETDGGDGDSKATIERFWDTFEEEIFDDPKTKKKETADDFYSAHHMDKTGLINRLLHKLDIESNKKLLESAMSEYFNKIEEYWWVNTAYIIYDAAVRYIEKLIKAYDDFYEVLEKNVSRLAKDIDEIENMYNIGSDDLEKDGMTVRYVCANKQCMSALSEEVVNMGTSLDIPAELTFVIYDRVRRYAMADSKPLMERYFSETYEDSILGFYRKSILSNYESTVCMDVLTATAFEAKVMQYANDEMTDAEKYNYIKRVVESTRYRARPFISRPNGEEPRIIDACSYSKSLYDAEETGRKAFVDKYLGDFGGVATEEMDPNRIVFFQGIYSLRANRLMKFAAPKVSETVDFRSGGDYFKAYNERIQRLHPDSRKSKAISPHIDRWWHVITKMPDIDENYQKHQLDNINAAFFWGLIGGYVNYENYDTKKMVYKLNVDRFSDFQGDDAELIVSNGTLCDKLYEVLDAFTIFPKVVNDILEKTENKILNSLNGEYDRKRVDDKAISKLNRSDIIKNSILFTQLSSFTLKEFPLEDEESKCRSIFEIPLLMKQSVPSEEYYEESMIDMFKTELNEVKKYLSRFCDKIEFQEQYIDFLNAQMKIFLRNITIETGDKPEEYRDSLFIRICMLVANEYENLYEYNEAEKIRVMCMK